MAARPTSPASIEIDRPLMDIRERFQAEANGSLMLPSAVAGKAVIGIPLPTLAQRVLFQSNVLPLGRVTHLAGLPGSGKSALLSELIRLHVANRGGGVVIETEEKDSSPLRNALFNWNPLDLDRVLVVPARTLEAQQQAITTLMKVAVEREDEQATSLPLVIGVDSLTAVAPEEQIENILDDGHASRAHPLAALLISTYLKSMPKQIAGYPFSLVVTNHMKPGTDKQGIPKDHVPGGWSVPFMESIELRCKKIRDISLNPYHGIEVELHCFKCAIGESGKKIRVNLIWWYLLENGRTTQYMIWDWYSATIQALLDTQRQSKSLYNSCMNICDIVINKNQLVWSDKLGIPQNEPVHPMVAGQLLEQRPDLLEHLHCALGVLSYYPFSPQMKFAHQYANLHQALELDFDQQVVDAVHAEREKHLQLQQQAAAAAEVAAAAAKASKVSADE